MDSDDPPKPRAGEAAGGPDSAQFDLLRRAMAAHLQAEAAGTVEGDDTLKGEGKLEPTATGDPEPAAAGGPTTRKKIRSTRTLRRPGVLRVKEYPISEDTLDNIGTLRVSAAFWFAIGSLALGFALSALLSVSLTGDDVDESTKAVWWTIGVMAGVVALIAYGAGAFYFSKGKGVVDFVKENTIHDPLDED